MGNRAELEAALSGGSSLSRRLGQGSAARFESLHDLGMKRGRHRGHAASSSQALVERVGDLNAVLEAAEPQKKADLYERLGLSLIY